MKHVIEVVRSVGRGMLGDDISKEGEVVIEMPSPVLQHHQRVLEDRVWKLNKGAGGFVGSPDFWEILYLVKGAVDRWKNNAPKPIKVNIRVPSLTEEEKEALNKAFEYYVNGVGNGEKLPPHVWATLQLLHFGTENGILFRSAHIPSYRRTSPPLFILRGMGKVLIQSYHWVGETNNTEEGWEWLRERGAVIFVPQEEGGK